MKSIWFLPFFSTLDQEGISRHWTSFAWWTGKCHRCSHHILYNGATPKMHFFAKSVVFSHKNLPQNKQKLNANSRQCHKKQHKIMWTWLTIPLRLPHAHWGGGLDICLERSGRVLLFDFFCVSGKHENHCVEVCLKSPGSDFMWDPPELNCKLPQKFIGPSTKKRTQTPNVALSPSLLRNGIGFF